MALKQFRNCEILTQHVLRVHAADTVTDPVKIEIKHDQRRYKNPVQIAKINIVIPTDISKTPRIFGLIFRNLDTTRWSKGDIDGCRKLVTPSRLGIFKCTERNMCWDGKISNDFSAPKLKSM